jgi:hypothetical protein
MHCPFDVQIIANDFVRDPARLHFGNANGSHALGQQVTQFLAGIKPAFALGHGLSDILGHVIQLVFDFGVGGKIDYIIAHWLTSCIRGKIQSIAPAAMKIDRQASVS